MNEQVKTDLRAAGVNVEGALARLMNSEGLYEKLLVKFKADANYTKMVEAIQEQRYEDAFHCAHTLKGVAGNLGLDRLMEKDIVIVEKLRKGVTEGVEEDLKEVKAAYEAVMTVIQTIG